MPARTNGATVKTAAPVAKHFELPALDFKFGSLTEGTNIPPPPPSPIEEKPLPPPAEEKTEKKVAEGAAANGAGKANGNHTAASPGSQITKTTTGGTKRPAEDVPTSPTSSARPNSIRRLFSRNLLNRDFANGEQASTGDSARPASRSNGSFMDDKKAKRSSGWFRRLRSSDGSSKRASQIYSAEEVKKVVGPPPPMIPELSDLEAKVDVKDEGSLGSDLFKDIKIAD